MANPGAAPVFSFGGRSATSTFSFGGRSASTSTTFSFGASTPILGAAEAVARPASKTTLTPRKDLLPELWQQIFENMAYNLIGEELSTSVALKHVVLVSKGWQIIAQPVFYRYLKFSHLRTLENFSMHILSQAALRNRDVGQWIRTLNITDFEARKTVLVNEQDRVRQLQFAQVPLPILLCRLSNLREFSCNGYPCTHNELSSLAHAAQASMRRLSIVLAKIETMSQSGLAFSLLTQFRGLRELDITYNGGWSGAISLAETPDLFLPDLQYLAVHLFQGDDLISLLRRSRFPRLNHVKFGGRLEIVQVEKLRPFFVVHQVRVLEADVALRSAFLPAILALVTSAKKIIVEGRVESGLRLAESLPTTCASLVISFNDMTYHHLDAIVARMRSHSASRLPHLKRVCFSEGFSWQTVGMSWALNDQRALAWGKVLHYDTLLAPLGVRILDDKGGIMSYKVSYEEI